MKKPELGKFYAFFSGANTLWLVTAKRTSGKKMLVCGRIIERIIQGTAHGKGKNITRNTGKAENHSCQNFRSY